MSLWKRARADDVVQLEARIRHALEDLAPLLRLEDATIELVSFERVSGVATLRFSGDCPDCRMSASTLRQGIEARLRMQVPEIRAIRAV
jgi:Fe-S cluster biogenesis protein NfuA